MKKTPLLIVAVIVVVAVIFGFLDFHAAGSNTQAEHQTVKTSMGEALPASMSSPSVLKLTVTGDYTLAPRLEKQLESKLRAMGRYTDVEVLPELIKDAGGPYLVVQVTEKKVFWTPFYSTSTTEVKMVFGSNGSVEALLNGNSVNYTNVEGPAMHLSGDFSVKDKSWGLMSYPGYNSMLASGFAKHVSEAMAALYQGN